MGEGHIENEFPIITGEGHIEHESSIITGEEGHMEREFLIKNPLCLSEKPCTVCNIIKPLENFYNADEHCDGKENSCKDCVKIRQQTFIENKRKTTEVPTEKSCTQCEKILPLSDFYTDNSKFDKKSFKCKECVLKVQDKSNQRIEISEYCCTSCNITKPIDEFHVSNRSKTGHIYHCKSCKSIQAKNRVKSKNLTVPTTSLPEK